jgi:hypothetical protein
MNSDDIVLRQQLLLVRSAQLRIVLSDQVQVLKKPLAVADQVQTGLHWLYRHPQWPLGALMAFVIFRPKRTFVLGGRLWWAWKTFKRFWP